MARMICAQVNGVNTINEAGTLLNGSCNYIEAPNQQSGTVNWSVPLNLLSTLLTINQAVCEDVASGINEALATLDITTDYHASDVALFGGLTLLP